MTPAVPRDSQASAEAMEALYPFLYAGKTDLDAVLAEVRQSTVAKAREIMELRKVIAAQDAGRMRACAQEMASRFEAGGRLLAFGNGGSATDAQQIATLFLNPGGGERPLPAFGLANDTAVITALCNDIGVDVVFAASGDLGSYSGFKQGDPQYEALVTAIHDATLKAGRRLGGPQAWMNRQGFSFFQGAGETALITAGAQLSLKTSPK